MFRKVLPGRMTYITVTENAIKWWVTVNGLNHHEVDILNVKIQVLICVLFRRGCYQRRCQISQSLMMIKRRWWSSVFLHGRYNIDNLLICRHLLACCQILNGLERMGYRVVTSSCMITGYGKHDTRDFIWTLHKTREEWDSSSK